MIKRDQRNIGKLVEIHYKTDSPYNGKRGLVTGFRGDFDEGIPFVNVFIFDNNSWKRGAVYPVPGCFLIWTGNRKGG